MVLSRPTGKGGQMHRYSYAIDDPVGTPGAKILRMVTRGSRVLEIGAGPGSITRPLVEELGCEVVAVENDPHAIPLLRQCARSVYELDLNDGGWARALRDAEAGFDYVIAADVLEHLIDPERVMAEMQSLLNPGGAIILSLPHAGHAAIQACLWNDDFAYQDTGLLDRTHIRFFGMKNIQSMACAHGMVIAQADFVVRHPAAFEFARYWKAMPWRIRSMLLRKRFATTYQVITRSTFPENAEQPIDLMQLRPPAALAPRKKLLKTVRKKMEARFARARSLPA